MTRSAPLGCLCAFAAALVLVFAGADIAAGAAGGQNPFTSRADATAGERLFQRNCVLCHGANATGGRGPDLTRGFYRRGNSDPQLFANIQDGLPDGGMPWLGLNDKNTWQIISYLRSLSAVGEADLPGDAESGRAVFFGVGNCATCHMVNGSGGRQGPDLSWVGWARAPDYLRAAILEPNADIEPRWWTGVVQTEDGAQIEGYLVSDDQFTVRILDADDNLHAFTKSELRGLERKKDSTMPPANLDDEQLEDLVAFLAGLRGQENDQ